MPDFPLVEQQDSLHDLFTFGPESLLGQAFMVSGSTIAASAWTTANTAVYVPVTINTPLLAQKMAVQVGTQSGNLDVGIYNELGTKIVSAGSTAVAVAGLQVVDITDTWMTPGTYFIAMNCDNTTATFFGVSLNAGRSRCSAVVQQGVGAVTLPSPAVFATYTTRTIPVVMVAGTATV